MLTALFLVTGLGTTLALWSMSEALRPVAVISVQFDAVRCGRTAWETTEFEGGCRRSKRSLPETPTP